MTKTPTRHDRRRDRTRQQLQDALLELLLAGSFESIVVQEITDQADVGRGTFYFHFDSKEELLCSIAEDRFLLAAQIQASLAGPDPLPQPEYYLYVNAMRYIEKNKPIFLAIFGPHGSQAVASQVTQALAAEAMRHIGQGQHYREIGQPAEITAQMVVRLTLGLGVWWLSRPPDLTAVQVGAILYKALHHREPPGGTWQEGYAA